MAELAPARLAATLILVRDGADGLEAFMVVRHRQIDFASGALVFPGGRVEDGDAALGSEVYDARERALRVAAIRETFEECGVLLAREAGSGEWLTGAHAAALAKERTTTGFADLVGREKLELGTEALVPFAHWITPTAMPKRFDTAFYIVAAPPDQDARHDGSESVDSVWIAPRKALEGAERGVYTIVPATALNLALLGESADASGALAAAQRRRIVTVEPIAEKREAGWRMHIPLEAGYGVEVFDV